VVGATFVMLLAGLFPLSRAAQRIMSPRAAGVIAVACVIVWIALVAWGYAVA
jgi:hypothetical protein